MVTTAIRDLKLFASDGQLSDVHWIGVDILC